jgi:hypothetical protein
MRSIILIIVLFSCTYYSLFSQPPFATTRELCRDKMVDRKPWDDEPLYDCSDYYKVKYLKGSCEDDVCHLFQYPVLIENFDNIYDLPNKWRFAYENNKDDNGGRTTWMNYGYFDQNGNITNHNVNIVDGELLLTTRTENPPILAAANPTAPTIPYGLSSGMIKSLNNYEYGTFEARIQIPSVNKMWPAFWLIYSAGNYSEIDIFEFWDGDIAGTNCEKYSHHVMSVHSGQTIKGCLRADKYPLENNLEYHTYKLVWNKYEISIYVDNIKKGYATKYYDKLRPDATCDYGSIANILDPNNSYSCGQLNGLPNQSFDIYWTSKPNRWPKWLPWIPMPIPIYHDNYVYNSSYFPSKYSPMSIVLNNNIHKNYLGQDFSNYTEAALTMKVDWIKVYQPFCCGVDKTVVTSNDIYNQTNNTGFLTGRILTIGNNPQTTLPPLQQLPWETNKEVPFIILATDEIRVVSEAIFEGYQYTEMRITDCNGTSGARLSNDNSEQPSNNQNIESANFDANEITSLDYTKNEIAEFFEIYPVPTSDFLQIKCDDSTFEKIIDISLIDLNGKNYKLTKSTTINIENFDSGCYQLRIILNNGKIINKKVIKI